MAAKGYSQKDVLQSEVQKAYAESIGNIGPVVSGSGGSGIVSDMLSLGVGIAAASAIAPQLGGMMQSMSFQPQQPAAPMFGTWDCTCGQKGIIGNFCNNCGAKKPAPVGTGAWDCACGNKGVIGNFCPNCGAKKPEPVKGWDCACGQKSIMGNFCPNCGTKRPEQKPLAWDCACGNTGITGNFCPNCGKKRGE